MGARQSGVSYADVVQSNTEVVVRSQAQSQVGTTRTQPVVMADVQASQTATMQLDALEAQVNTLSASFQVLLTRLDSMTSAINSVGQAVDAVAARMPVSHLALSPSNLTGADSHDMVLESPKLMHDSH